MYCINCGKELREGAKFCSNCGTPVPDAQNAESVQQVEPTTQAYSQGATTTVNKPKNKNTGIIIAIAIAAVAIIVAIIAIVGKGGSGGLSANAVGKLNGTYVEQSGGITIQFKKDGSCIIGYSYTDNVFQDTYTIGDGNRIYFSDSDFGSYQFIYDERADVINCEEMFLTFYHVKDEKALADDGKGDAKNQKSDEAVTITFGDYEDDGSINYHDVEGIYSGAVKKGKPEGNGTFTAQNSSGVSYTYTGTFSDGAPHGYGVTSWENGYEESGTYTNGLYTPTLLEALESFGKAYQEVFGGYSLSPDSKAFIENHQNCFPTQEYSDVSPYINDGLDLQELFISAGGYPDMFVQLHDLEVVQVFDYLFGGWQISAVLMSDNEGNCVCVYLPCETLFSEGDMLTVIALPLDNASYTNASGGTTDCVALLGSYILADYIWWV